MNYMLHFAMMVEHNNFTGLTIGVLLYYFITLKLAITPEGSRTGSQCSHRSESRIAIKRHT